MRTYKSHFQLALYTLLLVSIIGIIGTSAAHASVHKDVRAERSGAMPFEPTEELVYEAELSRALLRGINVAEFRFAVGRADEAAADANPTNYNQSAISVRPVLRFTADIVSKGLLRQLLGIRFHQHIESTVEPASFTLLRTIKLDEQGDRQRTSEAVFDRTQSRVVWTERDPRNPERQPRTVVGQVNGAVQDIASVFYFLRTQPLTLGARFDIALSDSGQVYQVPVHVVEKRQMRTVLGSLTAVRVDADVFGNDDSKPVPGKGTLSVWFTDDARRIPVRARATSEQGTLDIKLRSVNKRG